MQNIINRSATEIVQLIRQKKISCTEVASTFIAQIQKINPIINAIHQFDPERILQEAKQKDNEIAHGKPLGKLHGLPISIKNDFSVKNFICDKGSYLLEGNKPNHNATVVERLLAEGAIILGLTNVPEMCASYETDNLIYGRTNNPYDLARVVGGSSGGEAALIAAGGSVLGIGTDGGGSVRVPAHYTGISSHKPTNHLVPLTGMIPTDDVGCLVSQLITAGPMARYVEDLTLMLSIMAGPDGKDSYVNPVKIADPANVEVRKLKVAFFVDNHAAKLDKDTKAVMHDVMKTLQREVAAVEEIKLSQFKNSYLLLWETIFYAGDGGELLSRWIATKPGVKLSPLFQDYCNNAKKCKLSAYDLRLRFVELDQYRREIFQVMQNYDALICPVSTTPAPEHGGTAQQHRNYIYSMLFNLTGWPATTIRAGTSAIGLPIGIQVAAKSFQDHITLALAKHLQGIFGVSAVKDSFLTLAKA